jgi:hypothetical protein
MDQGRAELEKAAEVQGAEVQGTEVQGTEAQAAEAQAAGDRAAGGQAAGGQAAADRAAVRRQSAGGPELAAMAAQLLCREWSPVLRAEPLGRAESPRKKSSLEF